MTVSHAKANAVADASTKLSRGSVKDADTLAVGDFKALDEYCNLKRTSEGYMGNSYNVPNAKKQGSVGGYKTSYGKSIVISEQKCINSGIIIINMGEI